MTQRLQLALGPTISLAHPQVAFNRVARGMLHQDHITFAMLLARIKLKGTIG